MGTKPNSDNPWDGAWYQYVPSVGHLANCANYAHDCKIRGCEGGTLASLWNSWMRSLKTDLWRTGESCMPYKLKCYSSAGVVNPVSGGQCSNYKNHQLWHKPCNCIPTSLRPTGYHCSTATPSQNCGVPVPPAVFLVKHMAHGLSTGSAD